MASRSRKPANFLHQAAVKPGTHVKYKRAVIQFVQWCLDNNESAADAVELDELLNEFIHYLYETGGAHWVASCALHGSLFYLPSLRGRAGFPLCRLALRGWSKQHPPRSWSPLTWPLVCVIAVQFARMHRVDMAVAVVLAFDCLLRVGELTGLAYVDVGDAEGHMGLRLRKTKTGDDKFVRLRKPETRALLRAWMRLRPSSGKLFDFNPQQFRSKFRQVCNLIGLDASYVPHSCRHGGATELFIQTQDLHLVMIVGRWAVEKSARSYIQDGRAILIARKPPRSVVAAGKVFAKDFLRSLAIAVARSGRG